MVDLRIYRNVMMVTAFAVIVFAFSLQTEAGPAVTTLAPPSFAPAYQTVKALAKVFPDRRPGSSGDNDLAAYIEHQLKTAPDQFNVSTTFFSARTSAGRQRLETVTATRTGLMPGTVVVVAGRDANTVPATASLSGTAVLLQLARALSGETQQRTVMLVSTSGSVGAAGAEQIARSLAGQSVDAVIVLGDLAGARVTAPVVVPWSDAPVVAPATLIRTLASAIGAQAGLPVGQPGLLAQFVHQAFPLTTTEQGPFGRYGEPAVLVSVAGNREIPPSEPISKASIATLGQAVLQAVGALDSGPLVPPPSSYLRLSDEIVPAWAIRLLALALLAPVLITMLDAVARMRRRRHSIGRWVLWSLSAAVPFILAGFLVKVLSVMGLLDGSPAGPVGAGEFSLGSTEIVLFAALALVIVGSFVLVRPVIVRRAKTLQTRPLEGSELDGASVGLVFVMSITTGVVWLVNPFAALLVVPTLHLWMWFADARVRERRTLLALLFVLGLVPTAVVVGYYVHSLGVSVPGLLWNLVLMIAGGQLGPLGVLYWSVLLGCAVSALVVLVRVLRERKPVDEQAVTVRGPVTYAGPGSLGGTESALRR